MVKDGYKFAAAPLVAGIVALVLHWNWLGGVLIFLGMFVLFFFRDPERTPPQDPNTDRFPRRRACHGNRGGIA